MGIVDRCCMYSVESSHRGHGDKGFLQIHEPNLFQLDRLHLCTKTFEEFVNF